MADENAMSENLQKHMEALAKGVTSIGEGVQKVDSKVDTLARENAELKAKLESKNDDGDDINDELEDLLEDPKEQKKRMKEELKSELKNELGAETAVQREQEKWDTLAYKEFPSLNDQTSKFYIETKKEIQTLFPVGYDKMRKPIYSPDAVYNAAARVHRRGQKEGWIGLELPKEEGFEEGGSFNKRMIKGKKISDIQRNLCKMWSVDEKKVEERIKKG